MIECSPESLPLSDETRLRAWLRDPAAKIFIKILEHRAKRLQVEAMNDAQSNTTGYANLAGDKLKQAQSAEEFAKLMVGYVEEKESPQIVKLS